MANSFQFLVGSDAFLAGFSNSLAECRESLYAQFMTFDGDASGQRFAEMLMGKAAEGVKVRLLIDGYADAVVSDIYPYTIFHSASTRQERIETKALFKQLARKDISVKRTAPFGFMGKYFLFRDHKKMIILDNRIAFVGGINISDHNYAWHDFMVRIEGPLVSDLTQEFCSTWDGNTKVFDQPNGKGDYILNQGPGRPSIHEKIFEKIDGAQHSLVIESPYLLGEEIEARILEAAERGVQVILVTPYFNNKWIYRTWFRTFQRRLTHPNISFYGYRGNGGMTHAKLLVVDDKWVSFGSCNLFELAGLTHKDLNVFSNNPDLVTQASAFIADELAQSEPLKPPRFAVGYSTYSIQHRFFQWWTDRLLQNATWKAIYG